MQKDERGLCRCFFSYDFPSTCKQGKANRGRTKDLLELGAAMQCLARDAAHGLAGLSPSWGGQNELEKFIATREYNKHNTKNRRATCETGSQTNGVK